MDFDEKLYRQWTRRAAAWAADYHKNLRCLAVRSSQKPGDSLARLPLHPPPSGEKMEDIFRDFESLIPDGLTHWQHPNFYAYFPAGISVPSLLAEQLTAAIGAQCMLWQTSPVAAELEIRMMEWLGELAGLPKSWRGVIQDSASSATLAAVLTAREKAINWRGKKSGLSGQPTLRFYTTATAHSSVEKAARLAGVGEDNLVRVAVNKNGAMRSDAFCAAIKKDKARGWLPAGLVATLGATGGGECDDLKTILPIAADNKIYSHIDAAWAGAALLCPEHRYLIDGVAAADSFVFNPHKWLLTNFDCAAHFVRDEKPLQKTLAVYPDYLQTQHARQPVNFSEWSIPLGRRFRALKLWFVIRHFGRDGLQKHIRRHIALAQTAANLLRQKKHLEIVTEPFLSLFTFRCRPPHASEESLNAINAKLLDKINARGRLYLTQTIRRKKYLLRFQVGQSATREEDIKQAVDEIANCAKSFY